MESKSGVCTPNTYVKSAKNRGEILVPGVFLCCNITAENTKIQYNNILVWNGPKPSA